MVKHFNAACPSCQDQFHVHHEDLRFEHVKLFCPYCGHQFYLEESAFVIEHDGTIWRPQKVYVQ